MQHHDDDIDENSPCSFVIFGATGNLAQEKLIPSLFQLEQRSKLPEHLSFVAFARREWTNEEWRAFVVESLNKKGYDTTTIPAKRFLKRFEYLKGELKNVESYHRLRETLSSPKNGFCTNVAFYLSIKPDDFTSVVKNLHEAGLNEPRGTHRIVVEKPFGKDIDSAMALNNLLHEYFDEKQIFRIDHYLGKETVQNLLVFRFANSLIEPIWNRNHIEHVQITVSETAGIGNRADYYERSGALRDMIQNHLMQLMTIVAMEPPPALEADALRDEKVKVLRSVRMISKNSVNAHAFKAQYKAGQIKSAAVQGYQNENGVEKHSTTETFAAVKFYIDNWRWRGVPFYLRTGKRLKEQTSKIAIKLKHPPQQLFNSTPLEKIDPNWILLSVQPEESMKLEIQAKKQGIGFNTRTITMDAGIQDATADKLDAYATLLLDVMRNDRTLFIRFDEVEWAWRIVDPIIRQWESENDFIHTYAAGTWGPQEANRLFDLDDSEWRNDF